MEAINAYGTVSVRMTPEKRGRAVHTVRFDWAWKDPHTAAETAREGERHSRAQGKAQEAPDAPPMIAGEPQAEPETGPEPALAWWAGLSEPKREGWADAVGRTFEAGGMTIPRREADLARMAFERATAEPGAVEQNETP